MKYKIEEGRNYFIDLLNIHTSLGLSVQEGSAFAFASLVSIDLTLHSSLKLTLSIRNYRFIYFHLNKVIYSNIQV